MLLVFVTAPVAYFIYLNFRKKNVMLIPERYSWLTELGPLPKLVQAGLQYLGLHEIPGSRSNPVILDMARGLGLEHIYSNDDTEWCALFVNHLIRITQKPMINTKGDRWNLLRARWLLNWGHPVAPGDERLGDVAVFERGHGAGHVFINIAQTPLSYLGLGGNQANQVSFAEINRLRLLGMRRFYQLGLPGSAQIIHINSSGRILTNET